MAGPLATFARSVAPGLFRDSAPAQAEPAPSSNVSLYDGVSNPITGMGGTRDASSYNSHFFRPLSQYEIETSYRGSWLMRKLIDLPAKEQVRTKRAWQTDKPNIALLEAEEKRLKLWDRLERAERLRGLGGGAIVIWVAGDDQTAPLDPARVRKAGITSLSVWSRYALTLGERIFDLSDPWYEHPSYYEISSLNLISSVLGVTRSGPLKLHPSRVVEFRANDTGQAYGAWQDSFWGDSDVQVALAAVLNSDTSQAGFSALVKDAVNVIIGIPGLTEMMANPKHSAILQARVDAVSFGKSMYRAIFRDAGKGANSENPGETIEYRQTTWTGIPDVMMAFVHLVAASRNMPATILLGKSPDGMNATGAGDFDAWEREIDGRREVSLRSRIERIDDVLIPSALGRPDPAVWWKFPPLSLPSAKEQAETEKSKAETIKIYVELGLLPTLAVEKSLQNQIIESGVILPGFDDAAGELDEVERFPSFAGSDGTDPSALQSKGGDLALSADDPAGDGSAGRRRAVNDAAPRPLYVSRKVKNVGDLKAWAEAQGMPSLDDDLHVTIAFSRAPVDWIAMGASWADYTGKGAGDLLVTAGGPRLVEPLGDRTAVLLFASSDLCWRNREMREAGASWDHPDYQPHISLTGEPVDLTGVEPYRGKIELGPEIFEEIKTDRGS